jgi:hypothetical protein
MIIQEATSVDIRIIDVQDKESGERLKIHNVHIWRYIGRGNKGLQKTRDDIQSEYERLAIWAQVRWLSNPSIIMV